MNGFKHEVYQGKQFLFCDTLVDLHISSRHHTPLAQREQARLGAPPTLLLPSTPPAKRHRGLQGRKILLSSTS
ncbi:hypothetical protein NW768_009606 [Fusarium equiseti]|uniref:Uncharacterized protein n=1 Tax=Fusarium equiseti TaxID=61235 RepID=A0ABQ8R2T0_FUSEQ|nr:hypothetical protein NW768_009606 [Fusarium equiseti]